MTVLTEFDNAILDFLQELHNGFLDSVMIFFTRLGDGGFIWILLALILLCFKKTRHCGLVMGGAMLLGLIFANGLIKNLVNRPRPCDLNDLIALLIPRPNESSFPSGHTTSSFAAAAVIFHFSRKWSIAAYFTACMIAFSRMYLYVHFPTDVLAGMLLGTFFALIALYLYRKVKWDSLSESLKQKFGKKQE